MIKVYTYMHEHAFHLFLKRANEKREIIIKGLVWWIYTYI
jgi:hypothetical protein